MANPFQPFKDLINPLVNPIVNPFGVVPPPTAPLPGEPMMTPVPAPATPQAPLAPQMSQIPTAPAPLPATPEGAVLAAPKPYAVVAGDSVNTIAMKFGVAPSEITGYRSGDPNKIFPGEILSIGRAPALAPAPTAAATPATPAAPTTTPTAPAGGGTTANGATVDAAGNIVAPPAQTPEEQAMAKLNEAGQILREHGLDPNAIQYGFNTNPTRTVSDIVAEVMKATGLPDAKAQMEKISKGIEDLQNERDDQIQAINDNPFTSTGTKNDRITALTDKYEKKIANRTDHLQLLQSTYDSARQESQFAATTAINLYDKNRSFDQSKLEFAMTQAEKALEASRKAKEFDLTRADKAAEKAGFSLPEGQKRYEYDPKTGTYKLVASAPSTDSSIDFGGGGGGGTGGQPEQYKKALQVILGSGKFTKDQKADVIRAINSGGDPFTVVKNQAKNMLGQTGDTKLTSYEVARDQLNSVEALLNEYYAAGGSTNLLKGNYEKVLNKLGTESDPARVEIATQIAAALQIYRNAVSGTAYSVQEGVDIATIFPGINKTEGLNKSILNGRRKAFESTIDSSYRSVLGDSYDELKKAASPSSGGAIDPATKKVGEQFEYNGVQVIKRGQDDYEVVGQGVKPSAPTAPAASSPAAPRMTPVPPKDTLTKFQELMAQKFGKPVPISSLLK